MDLSNAVPLTIKQAKDFLKKIDLIISIFKSPVENDSGIFFQFIVTPEQKIYQQSQNVLKYDPILNFSYSQKAKNSMSWCGLIASIRNMHSVYR